MRPCLSTPLTLLLAASLVFSPKAFAQSGSDPVIRSSVTIRSNGSWRILLSAKDLWFDTNIRVVKDSVVNLRASGLVIWAPPGATPWRVGPNGTRPPYEEDKRRFPLPDAGCGSLIMRVGSSTYFVGEGASIKVNEAGKVQLMVNDDVLSDNSGSFIVDVDVAQDAEVDLSGLLTELRGLRQTILEKIDSDVESIAQGFSNSEAILRKLRVAYTFKTVLDTLTGTLSIISEITNVGRLKTSVMGVASPVEYGGSMMALHGAHMNGQTLAFVFDKNRYTSSVSQMLKSADSSQPFLGFDSLRYSNSIKLSVNGADGANMIPIPHRAPQEFCQTIQPRGAQPPITTTKRGLTELRQYVTTEFETLEDLVSRRSYSHQQLNDLRQLVRDAKRSMIESKSRPTTFSLAPPPGFVSIGCNTAPTQLSLGRVAANQTVLAAAYDSLNKNLQLEQVMTVKTVGDGIVSGMQIYTKGKGGRTLQTILDVSSKTSLAVDVGNLTVSKIFRSKPEEVIVEKPQEMLLAMPAEGTSLLLLTDALSQAFRYAADKRASEDPLLPPLSGSGSGHESRFTARLYNVDDVATVYINGAKTLQATYNSGGSTNLTPMLRRGDNRVRLTLENLKEGYTYGFEIFQDGKSIFKEECGKVNVSGCGFDERAGIVYDREVIITVDERGYTFNLGKANTLRGNPAHRNVVDVERIGPGRTPGEKMYQFTVPANTWVETSIQVRPNQEVMVHHFVSAERVTVRLGALTDNRLQRPGTILPLYTSRNCSADPGVRAKVPYTCVQLNAPESIKLFARQTVSVGIYVKGSVIQPREN